MTLAAPLKVEADENGKVTKSGGFEPTEIAAFNSPVGVFLDTVPKARVFTSGQAFSGEVRFANYGDGPFNAAQLAWSIVAEGSTTNKAATIVRVPFAGQDVASDVKVGVGSIGGATTAGAFILSY